ARLRSTPRWQRERQGEAGADKTEPLVLPTHAPDTRCTPRVKSAARNVGPTACREGGTCRDGYVSAGERSRSHLRRDGVRRRRAQRHRCRRLRERRGETHFRTTA